MMRTHTHTGTHGTITATPDGIGYTLTHENGRCIGDVERDGSRWLVHQGSGQSQPRQPLCHRRTLRDALEAAHDLLGRNARLWG